KQGPDSRGVRGDGPHVDRRERRHLARHRRRHAARAPQVADSAAERQSTGTRGAVGMTLANRVFWPFGHLGLKLLSLGLALLLWMVVSGEETVERGLRVPLELQQMPTAIELLGDVPTTVDVRVR